MPLLRGVELQGFAERNEHFARRLDVAALLQPRVPGRPDPGDHGDFFTPKSGRAPPRAGGQADVRRRKTLAPRAQKGAEFAFADLVGRGGLGGHDPHDSSIDTRIK